MQHLLSLRGRKMPPLPVGKLTLREHRMSRRRNYLPRALGVRNGPGVTDSPIIILTTLTVSVVIANTSDRQLKSTTTSVLLHTASFLCNEERGAMLAVILI